MSLKGDKYENADEVKARLEGTVVLYDGDPVYINQVSFPENEEERKEIARVHFLKLPYKPEAMGARPVRKYLSSRHFDLAPPKMGYVNIGESAVYVSRAPVRQYRQGMCANNMSFSDVRGNQAKNVGWQQLIASQGFVDMIKGKYPSFADAGKLLGDKDTSSVAVSRTFAFVVDHDLEALMLVHKGIKCGIAMIGDRAIKVPPKFRFLKEEMEECRIPIQ